MMLILKNMFLLNPYYCEQTIPALYSIFLRCCFPFRNFLKFFSYLFANLAHYLYANKLDKLVNCAL